MRLVPRALIIALALTAAGCQKLAESIVQAGLDELLDEWDSGGSSSTPEASPQPSSLAFLTGAESGSVECFVTRSGSWDPVYQYADSNKPIGIAYAGDAGLIITTREELQRGNQPFLTRDDLERETGATEFGLLAAVPGAPAGEVVVAATTPDNETLLVRIDATYGTILGTTEPRPATDVAGLTVVGTMAIVAEAPFGDIVCYDLTDPAPAGVVLVVARDTIGQPAGMAVGPYGTLFVASLDEPVVQEFDIDSGVELDRFRIDAPGLGGLRDIEYDAFTGSFLVTAGTDAIYVLDERGRLQGVHAHPGLAGATSITIRPR